ncbi:MAG: YceI family protein [Saprospiraceae bacterium]|uniref:YceI family protein n=1 Tax=Candidatus Opimibacter skivensis TaxID=2982028 RepID=A0A9D7SYL3_9BACT|nr:YceI family protein [Candidatus Opimibacter skivensis]
MKIIFSLILVVMMTMSFKTISVINWELDTAHSNLHFAVTHLMVSEIEGSLKITNATLTTPNEDFTDAVVSLEADMNTIDTDNDSRDTHLKSDDFFNVEKFPTMTFKSDAFKKTEDKKYTVTGQLTFHGITKTVTLDVIANPGVQPWDNKTIVGFKVTGKINRSDFDISASTPSAMLSDEVVIFANVIFVKN